MFEESHAIYGVKGVTALPLSHDRANIVLNTLAAKNAAGPRPSLFPTVSIDTLLPTSSMPLDDKSAATAVADLLQPDPSSEVLPNHDQSSPRVKFAEEDQIKLMTPVTPKHFIAELDEDSPPFPSSGASTPTSVASANTSPIAKTLADRLSFWSRLSKRTSLTPSETTGLAAQIQLDDDKTSKAQPSDAQREAPFTELGDSVEAAYVDPATERREAVNSIVQATAPAPESAAAQHQELENKVVRECIREYTKGGMYFAYNFGTLFLREDSTLHWCSLVCADITRSLQHKQQQSLKSRKERDLLTGLGAASPGSTPNLGVDTVDVLVEPYPTLPLWRRVDRQFWWNEWLSKPFVDAGVSLSTQ